MEIKRYLGMSLTNLAQHVMRYCKILVEDSQEDLIKCKDKCSWTGRPLRYQICPK